MTFSSKLLPQWQITVTLQIVYFFDANILSNIRNVQFIIVIFSIPRRQTRKCNKCRASRRTNDACANPQKARLKRADVIRSREGSKVISPLPCRRTGPSCNSCRCWHRISRWVSRTRHPWFHSSTSLTSQTSSRTTRNRTRLSRWLRERPVGVNDFTTKVITHESKSSATLIYYYTQLPLLRLVRDTTREDPSQSCARRPPLKVPQNQFAVRRTSLPCSNCCFSSSSSRRGRHATARRFKWRTADQSWRLPANHVVPRLRARSERRRGRSLTFAWHFWFAREAMV